MMTIHTINKLNSRIEDLKLQLGRVARPAYKVFLGFGESDEEFFRKNPDAGRRDQGIRLSFGTDAERSIRILQPE
jgi:hypothetical protein